MLPYQRFTQVKETTIENKEFLDTDSVKYYSTVSEKLANVYLQVIGQLLEKLARRRKTGLQVVALAIFSILNGLVSLK